MHFTRTISITVLFRIVFHSDYHIMEASISMSPQLRCLLSESRLYLSRSSSFCSRSMSTSASLKLGSLAGSSARVRVSSSSWRHWLGSAMRRRFSYLGEVCAKLVPHHVHLGNLATTSSQDRLQRVRACRDDQRLVVVLGNGKTHYPRMY